MIKQKTDAYDLRVFIEKLDHCLHMRNDDFL